MKRALGCILALCLAASVCDARVLVVVRKSSNVTDPGSLSALYAGKLYASIVTDILDRVTGGQSDTAYGYTVVRSDQIPTEYARAGILVRGIDSPSPFAVQYDAVVYVGMPITTFSNNVRLDSMFIANSSLVAAGAPRVPSLFLLTDENPINGSNIIGCAKCSLGVANNQAVTLTPGLLQVPGTNRGWFTGSLYQAGLVYDATRVPAGGTRVLVQRGRPAYENYITTGVLSSWRDSCVTWANYDSLNVWEMTPNNLGAAKCVFAYITGNGGPEDSVVRVQFPSDPIIGNERQVTGADAPTILMGLARLDSITGHRVFAPNKLPIRLAVTVDGGFMRTTHLPGPGIRPQDSTVVKGSLDSLAALMAAGGVKIPITVGVNVDSMTVQNYRSELAWWRKLPLVRFSPQPWRGVKTPVTVPLGDGRAGWVDASTGTPNIVDPLGFRRSRTFVGDAGVFNTGNVDDADTSVCTLLIMAKRQMLGAGVLPEEMSHTLLPALDDWSPVNHGGGGTDRDSMLYAIRRAGFSTVRTNGSVRQSFGYKSGMESATFRGVSNGTWGYAGEEGNYLDVTGKPVKVLACGPRDIIGAYRALVTWDSTAVPYDNWLDVLPDVLYKTWTGITRTREYVYADYREPEGAMFFGNFAVGPEPDDDTAYYLKPKNNWVDHSRWDSMPGSAHVLALTMADLSGQASGSSEGNPARNGYWVLKSLKNQFDTINDFAGKTVIRFDYPEDIPVK